MSPVLRPGPAATVHELHTAQALDALRRTELARVRAAAASWRNGIGGLLAAVAGFGIVKGRSDIGELTPPWARAVGVLLLAALVIGTVGALSLIRAATGRPRMLPVHEFHSPAYHEHVEAVLSVRALRRGIALALAGAALLVAAVAATWYGPARPAGSAAEPARVPQMHVLVVVGLGHGAEDQRVAVRGEQQIGDESQARG